MKKLLLTCFTIGLSSALSFGANFTSVQNGNFTDAATWGNVGSGGGAGDDYPGPGDDITIDGHNVTYNIVGDTILYKKLVTDVAVGGSFTITGNALLANYTVVAVEDALDLEATLNIGPNAQFNVQGDIEVRTGGAVNWTDHTSILSISDHDILARLKSDLTVSNGIFALIAENNNEIQVDAGFTLTVASGGAIYFQGSGTGKFRTEATSSIILQDGAELVADLTNKLQLENKGSLIFEYGSSYYQNPTLQELEIKDLPPLFEIELSTGVAGWRHISSPLSDSTTLDSLVGTDFNPNVNSGQENIFWWDASVGSAGDPAPGWTAVTSLSDPFSYSSKPYIIYTGDANYPFSNNGLIQLTGFDQFSDSNPYTLYNSVDTATGGTNEGDQGWNLVGNPYPTWLNLDSILKSEMSGHYQGAHMWDPSTGQYKAYLANGETLENTHSNTGGSVTTVSNQYIRPFQAFWLKVDAASGTSTSISIKDEHRALDPTAAPPSYFKTVPIPRLRLNAYAASDSAWDQVLVAINPNASVNRLGNEDAFDRPASFETPNMALIHPDGERMCIDSRPLDSATVIPMDFSQGKDGETYYISMVQDQFDASMSAYLEDLKTNKIHDLKGGDYTFTRDVNYPQPRFKIHLSPLAVGVNELNLSKNNFQVWNTGDKVFVALAQSGLNQMVSVEVYNISGQLIYSTETLAESTQLEIPVNMSNGVNLIKVKHPQFGTKTLKALR